MKKPKLLFFDIETTNFSADLSPILCIGYKWEGTRRAKCLSLWDYKDFGRSRFSLSDKSLCEDFRKIIDEADAIIGHYSDRFDIPFVNSRFLLHNIPPIRGIAQVDTWKLARYNVKLTSNRLKNIGKFLDVKEKKGDNGGWATWLDIVSRIPKYSNPAQRKMVKYCKQDVLALESIFEELRPFAKNLPNCNLWSVGQVCHSCGSFSLQGWGYRYTNLTRYRRYRCTECGSVGRYDKKNLKPRGL